MKKLIYLLVMCIIMTAFSGCSGDSSKNNDNQKPANINILISSDISGDCMSTKDFDINKDFENNKCASIQNFYGISSRVLHS